MTDRPRAQRLADAAYDALLDAGMPEETWVSLPVPVLRDARLVASFFAIVTIPVPDGTNHQAYRPMATVVVDWEAEQVVETSIRPDILPVEEDTPVGLAFPLQLAGPPSDELEERIFLACDEAYRRVEDAATAYGRGLVADAVALQARGCERAYRAYIGPALWPLYVELNPDFFRWLEGSPPPAPAEPSAWSPTHLVPPQGMGAWSAPDPTAPILVNLEPALPLRVARTLGDWSEVVASNGWTGWVDGRLLKEVDR
ncbi:MAG: SH3 domain-containing protein [Actinomycetota bacterium]